MTSTGVRNRMMVARTGPLHGHRCCRAYSLRHLPQLSVATAITFIYSEKVTTTAAGLPLPIMVATAGRDSARLAPVFSCPDFPLPVLQMEKLFTYTVSVMTAAFGGLDP